MATLEVLGINYGKGLILVQDPITNAQRTFRQRNITSRYSIYQIQDMISKGLLVPNILQYPEIPVSVKVITPSHYTKRVWATFVPGRVLGNPLE